jgi:hypothetical protein
LSDTISPEEYRLLRCGYRLGEHIAYLATDAPLAGMPAPARRELAQILSLIDGSPPATSDDAAGRRRGLPSDVQRVYQLAVGRRWIADLELGDRGGSDLGAAVVARINRREVAPGKLQAPALLRHLRGLSLEALRQDMRRPRPALEWHYLALTGFLTREELEAAIPAEGSRPQDLRAELLFYLEVSPAPELLAQALFAHAGALEEGALSRWATSDCIALRLLPLVRAAKLGSSSALKEILTLALEYHGETALFHRAVQALFPQASNPGLYAKFAGRGDESERLGLVREVHRLLPEAVHRGGLGWVISGS